jgi:hypothetical protein
MLLEEEDCKRRRVKLMTSTPIEKPFSITERSIYNLIGEMK